MREDAVGKPDHTPIQKCTAAIRQLAYGGATDMFDEYLHVGKTTARVCLQYFCEGVREIFGERYLQKSTPEDCQALMDMHESQHGFPGKNCPAAWKGVYTTGFKGKNPTMILEAVADYQVWI